MNKKIQVGDTFICEMLKNSNGLKPICRINGIIAFIPKEEIERL